VAPAAAAVTFNGARSDEELVDETAIMIFSPLLSFFLSLLAWYEMVIIEGRGQAGSKGREGGKSYEGSYETS
jgi:hypothetical protein